MRRRGISSSERFRIGDNRFVSNESSSDKSRGVPERSVSLPAGVRTSDTTTEGIRVRVRSMFVPEQSAPRQGQFVFAYQITISNESQQTAQLVSRHWIITDAEGHVEEVKGPGVVGEQPVLASGESFEYTSYCPLKTSVGSMHGTYTMVRPGGDTFEARIAPFTLAMPNALN
jgi:ApaG protein